jgi:hypothetical protein
MKNVFTSSGDMDGLLEILSPFFIFGTAVVRNAMDVLVYIDKVYT